MLILFNFSIYLFKLIGVSLANGKLYIMNHVCL